MTQDAKTRARNNAYALLRSRPRSEFEIRQRLKLKGYGSALIDELVEDLRKVGEIDDEKFARLWVESKMHSNPAGDIVLRRELKVRGVADSIIESALADKAKNYDEHKIAMDMAVERFDRLKKLDRRKAAKRLFDFLLRKGFGFETVSKVVNEVTSSYPISPRE